MVGLTLTLLLHAAPAQVLVWGGGKTPEAAKESLALWTKRSPEWGAWISLKSGYPRVVDSSTVPGMNAGFHIVVLGACSDADVVSRIDLLKTLEASVYVKAVTWPEEACPALGSADAPLVPGPAGRLKTAAGELTVITLTSGGEDTWKTTVLTRWQPKGGEAVVKTFDQADCDGGAPAPRGGGLAYESTCVTGRCTSWGHSVLRYTYSVKDGAVVEAVKEVRVIDRAVCD